MLRSTSRRSTGRVYGSSEPIEHPLDFSRANSAQLPERPKRWSSTSDDGDHFLRDAALLRAVMASTNESPISSTTISDITVNITPPSQNSQDHHQIATSGPWPVRFGGPDDALQALDIGDRLEALRRLKTLMAPSPPHDEPSAGEPRSFGEETEKVERPPRFTEHFDMPLVLDIIASRGLVHAYGAAVADANLPDQLSTRLVSLKSDREDKPASRKTRSLWKRAKQATVSVRRTVKGWFAKGR